MRPIVYHRIDAQSYAHALGVLDYLYRRSHDGDTTSLALTLMARLAVTEPRFVDRSVTEAIAAAGTAFDAGSLDSALAELRFAIALDKGEVVNAVRTAVEQARAVAKEVAL